AMYPRRRRHLIRGDCKVEPTLHSVQVRGKPVPYQTMGEGDPVVLVHGLAASSLWWLNNSPVLAKRHRVYLIDLPGFGALNRHRPLPLDLADCWLLEWMRAAGIDRAHLVGHSMGGYICLRLAAHYPEMVDRLALVAPVGIPLQGSLLAHVIPLLIQAGPATPSLLPLMLYDVLRTRPTARWRTGLDILAEDARKYVGAISAPTLLIWGENDPVIPTSSAELMRREIPDCRLMLMRGTSHVPMFERPEEFNDALLRFLNGEQVGE
ncbi:MAG TPA: alpha/beta hydrolase, partial [Chloroflexota bacterium]|nr:alpha/beta hydrolase [Chloroflexota bacterium]